MSTTRKIPRQRESVCPALPDSDDQKSFWLAAYLRDANSVDVLTHHLKTKAVSNSLGRLYTVLSLARLALQNEANKSLCHAIDEGMLPFAHAHTTYFKKQGGAA